MTKVMQSVLAHSFHATLWIVGIALYTHSGGWAIGAVASAIWTLAMGVACVDATIKSQ